MGRINKRRGEKTPPFIILNSKFETRNPKQARMFKIQMTKTEILPSPHPSPPRGEGKGEGLFGSSEKLGF